MKTLSGGSGGIDTGQATRERADPASWATLTVRILSFTVQVSSNSRQALQYTRSLYPASGPISHSSSTTDGGHFVVHESRRTNGNRSYTIGANDGKVYYCRSALAAAAHLEHLLNAAAVMGMPEHLFVHAAAVATPAGGLVLPGPSGAGKSTLVAALSLSGFVYCSDELAAFEGTSFTVLPFLKAICLKDGGWRMLKAGFPAVTSFLHAVRADGEAVHYVAPPRLHDSSHRLPVRFVVLPLRRKAVTPELAPCSRGLALAELARNSLNLPRHGREGVDLLAGIVEGAECYTLAYDDLRQAVAALSTLIDPRRPSDC